MPEGKFDDTLAVEFADYFLERLKRLGNNSSTSICSNQHQLTYPGYENSHQ